LALSCTVSSACFTALAADGAELVAKNWRKSSASSAEHRPEHTPKTRRWSRKTPETGQRLFTNCQAKRRAFKPPQAHKEQITDGVSCWRTRGLIDSSRTRLICVEAVERSRTAVPSSGSVHPSPDVRLQSALAAGMPVESSQRLSHHLRVTRLTQVGQQQASQQAGVVTLARLEVPAESLESWPAQVAEKGVPGGGEAQLLSQHLHAAQVGQEVTPYVCTPTEAVATAGPCPDRKRLCRSRSCSRVEASCDESGGGRGSSEAEMTGKPLRRIQSCITCCTCDAGIAVAVPPQILLQSSTKGGFTEPGVQHSNHRCALRIADGVKRLVDFVRMTNVDLERQEIVSDKPSPDIKLRVAVVDAQILYPGREAFVKPQLGPPLHSDQISEPLMSHLVANNQCNSFHAKLAGILVNQQHGLPISGKNNGRKTMNFHIFHVKSKIFKKPPKNDWFEVRVEVDSVNKKLLFTVPRESNELYEEYYETGEPSKEAEAVQQPVIEPQSIDLSEFRPPKIKGDGKETTKKGEAFYRLELPGRSRLSGKSLKISCQDRSMFQEFCRQLKPHFNLGPDSAHNSSVLSLAQLGRHHSSDSSRQQKPLQPQSEVLELDGGGEYATVMGDERCFQVTFDSIRSDSDLPQSLRQLRSGDPLHLYVGVSKLELLNREKCPLCDWPLTQIRSSLAKRLFNSAVN
uniref:PARP n=1 Tax=Macrostomum lignano TaxID=282301 RepID=A0A1I8JN73_9PLAT